MLIDESRPAYRILTPAPKGFFGPDDTLYMDGECIYFDGIPNDEMEPLNTAAHKRMQDFLELQDAEARKVADKLGRPFIGRARTLEGALEVASAVVRAEMPVMGVKKEVSVTRIQKEDIPETGASVRRGPGRPPKVKGSLAIEKNTDQGPTSIRNVS